MPLHIYSSMTWDSQAVVASRGCRGAKSTSEEGDVGRLVSRDLHETLSDPSLEASSFERRSVELGKSAQVEVILEILQGERVVEDLNV